jgi:hypothetical protein
VDKPDDILKRRLNLVLRNVSDQHAGQPVDVVNEALQGMIAAQFEPWQAPKPTRVRRFAEEISALEPRVGQCSTCRQQVPLWITQPVIRQHLHGDVVCPGSGQAPE